MDKKRLRQIWRYARKIYPWYFLVIIIVFGTISLFALRANNDKMDVLRREVYAADKEGDPIKLKDALYKLHNHVVGHMNTSLTSGSNAVRPPIQLRYTYERAQAEQQKALGQNNASVYHDAQVECAAEHPGSDGAATIACIEEYSAAHGIQLGNIPDAAYKIDYVSATWSPDLAGWSLVATAFGLIGFIITSTYRWWAKNNL